MESLKKELHEIFTELDQHVYPKIEMLLDEGIMFCLENEHLEFVNNLSGILSKLRSEFESLIFFERKLVFKTLINYKFMIDEFPVMSVNNINELIRLIHIKEERISAMLELIDAHSYQDDKISLLVSTFRNVLIPCRAILYDKVIQSSLLSELKINNHAKE